MIVARRVLVWRARSEVSKENRAKSDVPCVTLNNSVQMPLLGFGVFQIPDLDECRRSVRYAIETG